MKREAAIADLASEGLVRISDSAGTGNSVVVGPTPRDPAGIQRCASDLKTWSAEKKYTSEERGGSRGPGVRRSGAGSSQVSSRSLILRAAMHSFSSFVNNFSTTFRFVELNGKLVYINTFK